MSSPQAPAPRETPLAAQRTLFSSSAIGAVIWAALIVAGRALPTGDDPVSHALMFAILVLVPLGLSLVRANLKEAPFFALLPYLLPPAQLAGVASLCVETGAVAAGAASIWVMVAILVFVIGLGRLRSSMRRSARPGSPGAKRRFAAIAEGVPGRADPSSDQRAYDVGFSFAWMSLPVGAVWLVMARAPASPFGLSSLLVSLTAVHFHFSSFVAPTVLALAWDRATSPAMRRVLALALGLVLLSVVLVAVGITVSPGSVEGARSEGVTLGQQLSRAGAIALTLAFLMHAITVIGHVGPLLGTLPRVLVSIASLAPLGALPLAVLYTFDAMDLDTMIDWHGALNAYGFAGVSLLGWGLERHGRTP